MGKTQVRSDVDKARMVAEAWAARNGSDPAEALGAAWLAVNKDRFVHAHSPSRQDAAMAAHMEDDLELAPAEASAELHPQPHPDEAILERQMVRRVHAILRTFPPRTERLLRLRFGFGRHEPMTLCEVGQDPGARVCKERTTQIINKGLRMMRYPTRAAAIREVATGDLGALVDAQCRYESLREAREWIAANRPEGNWDAHIRRKRERRKAEQHVGKVSLARYRARFGDEWYLQPATVLMALGAANDVAASKAA